jgi:hypothetical protein
VGRTLNLVMIKPSHYDDDGYVIQWRGVIPSNSLATPYELARDCIEHRVLGEDVAIVLHAWDETIKRIRADRITSAGNDG